MSTTSGLGVHTGPEQQGQCAERASRESKRALGRASRQSKRALGRASRQWKRADLGASGDLTHATIAPTIPPMTRDVLQAILRSAEATAEKAGSYRVLPEHRVTFYLGTDGRGMTVNEVEEIRLADAFVTLVTSETGSVLRRLSSASSP